MHSARPRFAAFGIALFLLTGSPGIAQETGSSVVRIAGPGEPGKPLRLIALGDAGLPPDPGTQIRQTLDRVGKMANADAILLLGDNVYGCGVTGTEDPNWGKVVQPILDLGLAVYPVLGNHDWGKRAEGWRCKPIDTDPGAQIKKSGMPGFERWIFPDYNYVVETPLAEIILLDSTPIALGWKQESKERLAGLRAALKQPRTRPWRIVAAHHVVHSCGDHGDDKATERFREAIESLLKNSEVDVYVSGHDHNLEIRSKPAPRPLYLISGSASQHRRSDVCKEDEEPNFKIVEGFAVLDITVERLTARFYCNGQEAPCMETTLENEPGPAER